MRVAVLADLAFRIVGVGVEGGQDGSGWAGGGFLLLLLLLVLLLLFGGCLMLVLQPTLCTKGVGWV